MMTDPTQDWVATLTVCVTMLAPITFLIGYALGVSRGWW